MGSLVKYAYYKISDSFPNEYTPAVIRLEQLIELNGFFTHSITLAEKVTVENENVQLFYRQYANPKTTISGLNDLEKTLVHCLYTRHYDGFIRQKNLQALINTPYPKIAVPFVLQLFGEYVFEIQQDTLIFIERNFETVLAFLKENPQFWQKQQRRVASYWNEYYRQDFPKFNDFPIEQMVKTINQNL